MMKFKPWKEIGEKMELIKVKSSNIDSIGWSANILRVLFSHGTAYDYLNVEKELYEELMEADSKGSFFNRYIKVNYPSVKVE